MWFVSVPAHQYFGGGAGILRGRSCHFASSRTFCGGTLTICWLLHMCCVPKPYLIWLCSNWISVALIYYDWLVKCLSKHGQINFVENLLNMFHISMEEKLFCGIYLVLLPRSIPNLQTFNPSGLNVRCALWGFKTQQKPLGLEPSDQQNVLSVAFLTCPETGSTF